jgi:hypothetical protein
MSTEPDLAADAPTLQIGPRQQAAGDPDPLAQITMRPRMFIAVLAGLAMLLGLVLALVPVHVAGPDPAGQARVSCGNTIGGVEMDTVAGGLGEPDQATRVAYVDMCERAVSERQNVSWTMFFGGLLVVLWLGVVRQRKPGEPGEPGLTR